MEQDQTQTLAVSLFSELLSVDQRLRYQLSKLLPSGMEISHFSVLNHLARINSEKTPAQLARSFHVTRGAMTNTLNKLEWAGYIHVRPDWEDARSKLVTISPAGIQARDTALTRLTPMFSELIEDLGHQQVRALLPTLRELRIKLEIEEGKPS